MTDAETSAKGQTWSRDTHDETALREIVEHAFDYRGDVTVRCDDGRTIIGFLYDRTVDASLDRFRIRMLPASGEPRLTLTLDLITDLAITGKDTAAGKSWEAWVRRYAEEKRNAAPATQSDLSEREA